MGSCRGGVEHETLLIVGEVTISRSNLCHKGTAADVGKMKDSRLPLGAVVGEGRDAVEDRCGHCREEVSRP